MLINFWRTLQQVNKNIASGEIEVYAEHIEILSKAKTPPFQVSDDNINEDTRLKYRYIDLRRPKLQNILKPFNRGVANICNNVEVEACAELKHPFPYLPMFIRST